MLCDCGGRDDCWYCEQARRSENVDPNKIPTPSPADFLEAAPPGTVVRYYAPLPADEDDFIVSLVKSGPWTVGGRTVVLIEDKDHPVDVGRLALHNPAKQIGGVVGFIYDK